MTFRLVGGDAIGAMQAMAENSVDAIVTDPPYGLEFMGKEWDRLAVGPNADRWEGRRTAGDTPTRDITSPGGRSGAVVSASKPNPKCRLCGHYRFSGTPCACAVPEWEARANPQARIMQEWHHAWATEALRILKPGGHLLAFGGTRTYHRLACAIEDAGFEIRDCLAWMYGSGFPKSLNVSKAIDKANGVDTTADERWVPTPHFVTGAMKTTKTRSDKIGQATPGERHLYDPSSDDAQRWNGWGTALKPAFEPIVLARKPLAERNVAANVQRWGTGALNVDGCRVGDSKNVPASPRNGTDRIFGAYGAQTGDESGHDPNLGRWPANVTLGHSPDCEQTGESRKARSGNSNQGVVHGTGDGTTFLPTKESGRHYADADGLESVQVWKCAPGCAVAMLDEQTGETTSIGGSRGAGGQNGRYHPLPAQPDFQPGYGDTGGASRFFYCPKADREERNRGLEHMAPVQSQKWNEGGIKAHRELTARPMQNTHPTVKPVELMRWLCRMVTPKGGTVLDPFTGSGSTGVAAMREGFEFIGIEREAEYVEIARARIYGDSPLFNVEAESV